MLISFAIENYKSFLNENILSLETKQIDEFDEFNTFTNGDYKLLKSTFIFGANASGKSNFLDAIYFMRLCVLRSFSEENFTKNIDNRIFQFNTIGDTKPTTFKIEFLIEKTRYYYEFSIKNGQVVREFLSRDIQKEVRIFERNSSDAKDTYISSAFSKMQKSLKFVRNDALIISTLTYLNDPLSKNISDWFKMLIFINSDNLFLSNSIYEDKINNYLKYINLADRTISEFRVEEKEIEPKMFETLQALKKITDFDLPSKLTELKYTAKKYNMNHDFMENIEVNFDNMSSSGTKNFMKIIIPIIDAIQNGKVIIIDELESMLHVSLVKFIFGLFNSIDINQKNAQLVTTTHDVYILNEDIRRDQINFVEKNEFAESNIYALTDFKNVTKNDNILKKYLLGFYGAVPQLKELFNAKID